jgi:hypothetical protein
LKRTLAVTLLALFSCGAHADFGHQVKVVGSWTIYKKVDVMTDKTECVATLSGKKNVQLTDDSLAFGGLGYAQGYKYRLDDEPLSQLVLNDDVPKKMGAVILEGKMFDRIKVSKRFRIQIVATELQTFDVDTSTVKAVLSEFKVQGCTGS